MSTVKAMQSKHEAAPVQAKTGLNRPGFVDNRTSTAQLRVLQAMMQDQPQDGAALQMFKDEEEDQTVHHAPPAVQKMSEEEPT